MDELPEFKLIVAGGRDFQDYDLLSKTLHGIANNEFADKQVSIVTGMARGADTLGLQFALEQNVKVYRFPASWDRYGKKAGYMRNTQMGNFADGLLAFWNGSKGTGHMINIMETLNKPVHIVHY